MSTIYDDTRCWLGEGPLWHPTRGQLYWFDITEGRLLTREGGKTRHFDLGENASAAGWVDDTHILVATETRLTNLDVESGANDDVAPLEADREETRSNDGRADRWGGFWIGTMHKRERSPAGTFYRYYKGEVRALYPDITIPNACCFAPDRPLAYFTDTINNRVMCVDLDPETGWPVGEPRLWKDLSDQDWGVDGAVTDAAGNIWVARWEGWGVTQFAPDGTHLQTIDLPAAHVTCPAFGGDNLDVLLVTTAGGRVTDDDRARSDKHGMVHRIDGAATGVAEPRVIL